MPNIDPRAFVKIESGLTETATYLPQLISLLEQRRKISLDYVKYKSQYANSDYHKSTIHSINEKVIQLLGLNPTK